MESSFIYSFLASHVQEEPWGRRFKIQASRQLEFIANYFPMIDESGNQFTAHILVLDADQCFSYASLKDIHYRIFSGKVMLQQMNGSGPRDHGIGDAFRVAYSFHSLQAIDNTAIIAQVVLNF